MAKLSPRTVEAREHIKHSFSKEKLEVLDAFVASIPSYCNNDCGSERNTMLIVKPDHESIKEYQVVECSTCKAQTWFVWTNAAI